MSHWFKQTGSSPEERIAVFGPLQNNRKTKQSRHAAGNPSSAEARGDGKTGQGFSTLRHVLSSLTFNKHLNPRHISLYNLADSRSP